MQDIVLQGFVKNFAEGRGMSDKDESVIFEAFAASTVLRRYHQYNPSDIDDILMGGDGDGGIDAAVILVNGRPAMTKEDVDFFIDKLRRLDVEFVFIQAKMSSKFDSASIGTFTYGVEQFFADTPEIEFREEVENLRKLKDYIYEKSISMEQNPNCFLYYVTTGYWKNDDYPKNRLSDGQRKLQNTNLFTKVKAIPIDADNLKTFYRNLEKGVVKTVELVKTAVFPKIADVTEAYVGLMPVDQFLKLVSTEDDDLNRDLFYDNVRDFQGNNPVNREIAQTIEDKNNRDRFPLLNNGVTIVARSINRTGDIFKISDFQIVNGCQTTHVLYQHRDVVGPSIYIPVKLVVTDNSEVITQVIKSTNRQTAVLPEALESLSPFHRELEDYYITKEASFDKESRIYYERRSKQYVFDRIKPSNIVTLTAQTKSFVGMFLEEPHSHPRYYGEILKAYETRLFVPGHNLGAYYASGLALLAVERLFNHGKLDRNVKKYKYHIIMLNRMLIAGADMPKINSKKMSQYSLKVVRAIKDESKYLDYCKKSVDVVEQELRNFSSSHSEHPSRLRAFTIALKNAISKPPTVLSTNGQPHIGDTENGEILWFDDWKNFGFIKRDAGGDIFVHITGMDEIPWHLRKAGTRVTYTVAKGPKSLKAENVRIAEA